MLPRALSIVYNFIIISKISAYICVHVYPLCISFEGCEKLRLGRNAKKFIWIESQFSNLHTWLQLALHFVFMVTKSQFSYLIFLTSKSLKRDLRLICSLVFIYASLGTVRANLNAGSFELICIYLSMLLSLICSVRKIC